ncbi:GNAT family N-acetyltransferase [Candidatus Woesearchaeota archaeon]|nr:GNAT family N-acetyltransferase [Candidatus Woesearchaeota archaeon]
MHIHIRKLNKSSVKENDIKEVAKLMFELYKRWDEIDPIDKINKRWFCSKRHHDYLKGLLRNKDCIHLVAEDKGRIVGYIFAYVEQRQLFLKKVGYISELYVLPGYRGSGLGKALVARVISWFKLHRLAWFTVSTHSLDEQANTFWQSRKFKEFNKVFKLKAG